MHLDAIIFAHLPEFQSLLQCVLVELKSDLKKKRLQLSGLISMHGRRTIFSESGMCNHLEKLIEKHTLLHKLVISRAVMTYMHFTDKNSQTLTFKG